MLDNGKTAGEQTDRMRTGRTPLSSIIRAEDEDAEQNAATADGTHDDAVHGRTD